MIIFTFPFPFAFFTINCPLGPKNVSQCVVGIYIITICIIYKILLGGPSVITIHVIVRLVQPFRYTCLGLTHNLVHSNNNLSIFLYE